MKHIITAALILFTLTAQADQGEWTVHTLSTHYQDNEIYNNINLGVAYNVSNSIRVGVLNNSYKHASLYVMKTHPVSSKLRIGWGAVSGYEDLYNAPVIPLFAVEYDMTDRFSVVWFGNGINLEVRL